MQSFLIVDDSPHKMQFLRTIVQRSMWPLTILVAITTEEAMSIIDAQNDIVGAFIDYYVPSDNGPSVIRYLRKKNPSAKIALVSSADSERNTEEARKAGADAVVCTSGAIDFVERRLLELVEEWQMNNE